METNRVAALFDVKGLNILVTGGAGVLCREMANALAPGFFLTEQNRFLMTEKETGALTKRGNQILSHTPMNRFGTPEDLVGPTLWLMSPASAFGTGIVVPVDGGFSAYSGV